MRQGPAGLATGHKNNGPARPERSHHSRNPAGHHPAGVPKTEADMRCSYDVLLFLAVFIVAVGLTCGSPLEFACACYYRSRHFLIVSSIGHGGQKTGGRKKQQSATSKQRLKSTNRCNAIRSSYKLLQRARMHMLLRSKAEKGKNAQTT